MSCSGPPSSGPPEMKFHVSDLLLIRITDICHRWHNYRTSAIIFVSWSHRENWYNVISYAQTHTKLISLSYVDLNTFVRIKINLSLLCEYFLTWAHINTYAYFYLSIGIMQLHLSWVLVQFMNKSLNSILYTKNIHIADKNQLEKTHTHRNPMLLKHYNKYYNWNVLLNGEDT